MPIATGELYSTSNITDISEVCLTDISCVLLMTGKSIQPLVDYIYIGSN